ncbi:hypothetical protein GCM10023189_49580 [Nibrella saemangeumensis]|uniref:Uncharacterized protein n=1 Tax=Nibrella saemangeumensis TaxID=1084526 RepID=A0ABP8NKC2_9BACT
MLVQHYRIDQDHSNFYTVWQQIGSPQQPTPGQVAIMEKAGQLQMLGKPIKMKVVNGAAQLQTNLPRQGVSLYN